MTRARTVAIALSGLSIAVAVRIHNAITYPPLFGFDAGENARYIERLTERWDLPDPTAAWSASDPPLFFYVSAALVRSLDAVGLFSHSVAGIRLLNTAAGLAIAGLAFALVRRFDPRNDRRALLAGGIVLFLPAHIQMSAMVNEEMFAALFASLALFLLMLPSTSGDDAAGGRGRAGAAGLLAGAALLTKLTGALTLVTGVVAYASEGWRRSVWRTAITRAAVFAIAGIAAGGWYYLRNRIEYGWFQPFGLPAHEIMFGMPPGERTLLDYLYIPLTTFTNPQLLDPDLLRSVWGSAYVSVWFDGHRFFLPRNDAGVTLLGTITVALALVPTTAFAIGLWRGLRRVAASAANRESPLLILSALTIAGFAAYTWQNPWFAVVKGTTLLGMTLPFAFYTSEVLATWSRRRGTGVLVAVALAALAVCIVLSCTFDLVFHKTEISGLPWQPNGAP